MAFSKGQIPLLSENLGARPIHMRSGCFIDNMQLPIHRWFRFSAGFSAQWVEDLLHEFTDPSNLVLDPFAGSGTTLICGDAVGVPTVGFEAHPFLVRIAQAKLHWNVNIADLRADADAVLSAAKKVVSTIKPRDNILLSRCFTEPRLRELEALRESWFAHSLFKPESATSLLIWLAISAILRPVSHVGTASWQYVLPNKRKVSPKNPFEAYGHKIQSILDDIMYAQDHGYKSQAQMLNIDSRSPEYDPIRRFNFIVTSPPYPNNFDYADATRLEMTFWGEVECWKDLRDVRKYLVRACTQHAAADRLDLDDVLADPILAPILDEIRPVCTQLAQIRLTRGGRKNYHTMIAGYFLDMADIWHNLRKLCVDGARLCFVIGDSAPYGVYVPADRWLGELAISAGFKSWRFEKIRDRNVKWRNRKHRVPLKEGLLWVWG